MKNLFLFLGVLGLVHSSGADDRTYVNCQSPEIGQSSNLYELTNQADGLAPEWKDLVSGSTSLGIKFAYPGQVRKPIEDAVVTILETRALAENLLAVHFSVKTKKTSLSPYLRVFTREASGWVLCGNYVR